jgi:transcriptional repressor NrdR
MICPYCTHQDTKVVDKRDFGSMTKRRRECLKCEKRFNTHENVQNADLKVIKKDGRREDFDYNKIKRGISIACEKRPVSTEEIESMIRRIEDKLRKKGKEVESKFIGEVVMKELKRADDVAYIRFASVYRNFQDANDFKKELKEVA